MPRKMVICSFLKMLLSSLWDKVKVSVDVFSSNVGKYGPDKAPDKTHTLLTHWLLFKGFYRRRFKSLNTPVGKWNVFLRWRQIRYRTMASSNLTIICSISHIFLLCHPLECSCHNTNLFLFTRHDTVTSSYFYNWMEEGRVYSQKFQDQKLFWKMKLNQVTVLERAWGHEIGHHQFGCMTRTC